MGNKVLICASNATHIENFHLPYIRAFRDAGWTVHTCCHNVPRGSVAHFHWEIPFQKRICSINNVKQVSHLARIFEQEQYDLLLIHTSLAAAWCRLAFQRKKCPKTKLAYVCHGYFIEATEDGRAKKAPKTLFYLLCERLLVNRTDQLFLMNQTDLQIATRYHLCSHISFINGMGLCCERLQAVEPLAVERLREQWGASWNTTVFLCVGEFSLRKNQQELLTAFSRLVAVASDVRLVLVGSGALEEICQDYVRKHQLEKQVIFIGQVADVSPFYAAADVLVSSSRSEGLPFNVLEALYLHLPVIASRIKGHMDLITDGENGLLYELGDLESLFTVLLNFCRQPELRAALQSEAALPTQYWYPQVSAHFFEELEDTVHIGQELVTSGQ